LAEYVTTEDGTEQLNLVYRQAFYHYVSTTPTQHAADMEPLIVQNSRFITPH
jgi:hypothetical protein